jgi:hypothetical protein
LDKHCEEGILENTKNQDIFLNKLTFKDKYGNICLNCNLFDYITKNDVDDSRFLTQFIELMEKNKLVLREKHKENISIELFESELFDTLFEKQLISTEGLYAYFREHAVLGYNLFTVTDKTLPYLLEQKTPTVRNKPDYLLPILENSISTNKLSAKKCLNILEKHIDKFSDDCFSELKNYVLDEVDFEFKKYSKKNKSFKI